MKIKIGLLALFMFAIISPVFFYGDEINILSEYYSALFLRVHNDFFEGLYITKGETKYSLGLFGGPEELENLMKMSSYAFSRYYTYKSEATIGSISYLTSIACIAGSYGYVYYNLNSGLQVNPAISTSLSASLNELLA
jgi:hypothetical protein